MKYLLLLSFITKIYSFNHNIIVLPMKKGTFAHIKIKDSFINYYSNPIVYDFLYGGNIYYDEFIFEGGKNLTKINSNDTSFIYLKEIDKENKRFKLISLYPTGDDFMNEVSHLLNTLGYINNKFYLEDKEKNYLFYGGIPQNVGKNYNIFSLKGLTYINFKMEVKFYNGTIYETSVEKTQISFNSRHKYIICLNPPIFNLFKKLILKNFDGEYCNRTYSHDEYNFEENLRIYKAFSCKKFKICSFKKEIKNLFPNFTFTIGNKILNLNKYNIFKDLDDIYTDLLIDSSPCNTLEFGKYFFELFDYSEYDKDTKIAKMYLEKNNSVFKEIEENFVNNKYIKTSKIDILILCSIIFMVTLFDIIIINKSKKIKYFNYYEINNY